MAFGSACAWRPSFALVFSMKRSRRKRNTFAAASRVNAVASQYASSDGYTPREVVCNTSGSASGRAAGGKMKAPWSSFDASFENKRSSGHRPPRKQNDATVWVSHARNSSAVGSATTTKGSSLDPGAAIEHDAAEHRTPRHGTAASMIAAEAAFIAHASTPPSAETTCSTTSNPSRGCFSTSTTCCSARRTTCSSSRSSEAGWGRRGGGRRGWGQTRETRETRLRTLRRDRLFVG